MSENQTPVKNETATTDAALAIFKDLLRLDPEGCAKLIHNRVKTTQAIVDHAAIQVSGTEANPVVGILGIVNGILDTVRQPRIAVCVDEVDKIVGFTLYKPA